MIGIVLLVCLSTCTAENIINQHTCSVARQKARVGLKCDLNEGVYTVDRLIAGVKYLEFLSFTNSSFIGDTFMLPDLDTIFIKTTTDIPAAEVCFNITTSPLVTVYVNDEKCVETEMMQLSTGRKPVTISTSELHLQSGSTVVLNKNDAVVEPSPTAKLSTAKLSTSQMNDYDDSFTTLLAIIITVVSSGVILIALRFLSKLLQQEELPPMVQPRRRRRRRVNVPFPPPLRRGERNRSPPMRYGQ